MTRQEPQQGKNIKIKDNEQGTNPKTHIDLQSQCYLFLVECLN